MLLSTDAATTNRLPSTLEGSTDSEIMRLVVTGPVASGKTSFVRSLSEVETVEVNRGRSNEAISTTQQATTLDFGRLQFSPNTLVHFYGTPGQLRFDFIWDILIRKAQAYIMLVAAHRPQDFRQARRILMFMRQRVQIPMAIGLTHTDCEEAWDEESVAVALGFFDPSKCPPILRLNPTDPASANQALITLVQHYSASR